MVFDGLTVGGGGAMIHDHIDGYESPHLMI